MLLRDRNTISGPKAGPGASNKYEEIWEIEMTAINAEPRWNAEELRWGDDGELDLGPRVRAELIAGVILVTALIAVALALTIG